MSKVNVKIDTTTVLVLAVVAAGTVYYIANKQKVEAVVSGVRDAVDITEPSQPGIKWIYLANPFTWPLAASVQIREWIEKRGATARLEEYP